MMKTRVIIIIVQDKVFADICPYWSDDYVQNGNTISEDQISEGIVRKKILSLTEKGRSYLREKGWNVPERKINAGAEHEYWKDKIKKDLIKQGAKVKEEVAV